MKFRVFLALVSLFALITAGCAQLEKKIASNTDRIGQLNRGQLDLTNRMEAVESKVGDLEGKAEEAAGVSERLEQLNREKTALEGRVAEIEAKLQKPVEAAAPATALRIKVLAGDGNIATARKGARKLEAAGYAVERSDLAPSKHFPVNKVFYGSGRRAEANKLADKLAGETEVLPLTWKSVFDIIVVVK